MPSRDEDRPPNPQWLLWNRRLQAIAQDGLTYTRDGYDLGRYEQLRELAAEILAAHCTGTLEEARICSLWKPVLQPEGGRTGRGVPGRADSSGQGTGRRWLVLAGRLGGRGRIPSEAAARETLEESGYRVRPVRLLAAYDRDRHGHPPIAYHVYKLVFLCEILDEVPSSNVDTDEVRFSPRTSFLSSITRVTRPQVSRFFEQHLDPGLPTDFD